MMPPVSGKPINVKCNKSNFPEFPDLLFGTSDEGKEYFNASLYIQSKGLSLETFFATYKGPIAALAKYYEINESELCAINRDGHFLIDSSLRYLFISFANPFFLAYVFERMDEIFSTGFTVSDTYLLMAAKRRLPDEILQSSGDVTESC